jgi:hypothetical protein
MRASIVKKRTLLLAGLFWMLTATQGVSSAPPPLPNPVLNFLRPEFYQANGKQWTRYRYNVENLADYPNELFAPAPDLPPCGTNTKSSRTWVDIYDSTGKRLYGFCALADHDGLGQLWFGMETDIVPPSWVYIELTDRKTGTKYKSNLAETTG